MTNETIIINTLSPLINAISSAVGFLHYFVGGLFGLYLIMVILQWHEKRENKKLLKSILHELQVLNKQLRPLNEKKKRGTKKNQKKNVLPEVHKKQSE
ncbi:MAG: hypothetical protein QW594_01140 [Candidatus Woesearchaeota archaeon]